MIPFLTPKMARAMSRLDVPSRQMSSLILTACYASIYGSSVSGGFSITQDFAGVDESRVKVTRAVKTAAKQLQGKGFLVAIEGGTCIQIEWEKLS